jgi:hypothetical protein
MSVRRDCGPDWKGALHADERHPRVMGRAKVDEVQLAPNSTSRIRDAEVLQLWGGSLFHWPAASDRRMPGMDIPLRADFLR